ncbi:hypothetical protein QCA50_001795 [Cerrena zonata]|uniref:Uncharacterized protein n=1 Tax=Cerrena zonata TaxID=2478898 RepID=A0AAW0GU73_9APHY
MRRREVNSLSYVLYVTGNLGQRGEGSLIVDAEIRSAAGAVGATATTTATTTPPFTTVSTTAATATSRTFEAGLNFEEDLFFLLSTGLGSGLGLEVISVSKNLKLLLNPLTLPTK